MNLLHLCISTPLNVLLYVDSWTSHDIYNGTGTLSPWSSFGVIATWLFALGIGIRGVSILVRASREGVPGQVTSGLINLLVGIVVFGVLWKIAGL